MSLNDPTYRKADIDANPVWELAHFLSELLNDTAPVGWSRYIFQAEQIMQAYDIKRKTS